MRLLYLVKIGQESFLKLSMYFYLPFDDKSVCIINIIRPDSFIWTSWNPRNPRMHFAKFG